MATAPTTSCRIPRRWLRYSLRTFLLAVTALCLFLGLYVKQRRDQQAAIATIQRWGGAICLDGNFEGVIDDWNSAAYFPERAEQHIARISPPYGPNSGWWSTADYSDPIRGTIFFSKEPAWSRRLLGDYFFSDIAAVSLHGYATMHLDTRPLTHLPKLTWLDLRGTAVDDDGLKNLRSVKSLEWLQLADTNVTDNGMTHLAALPRLKVLVLSNTAVTEQGVQTLRQALPNCTIKH